VTPDEAICELYKEQIKYSNNTTNLFMHLKRHYIIEYDEISSAVTKDGRESSTEESTSTSMTKTKQQSFAVVVSKKEAYKKNSLRYQTCQNVPFVMIYNQISAVDIPLFCKLLNTLDPRFQPYSQSQFSRVIIPKKYDEVKHSVKGKLEKAAFISTTDTWTGYHNCGYISFSAHHVGDSLEMHCHCLQTHEIRSSHTAQSLAEEISQSLDEWEITDKVVLVTTDNGQNIKNAITEELKFSHLGCVGHTLQLSIGKALQANSSLLSFAKSQKTCRAFS